MDETKYIKTEREDGSILFTPKAMKPQDAPQPGEVWQSGDFIYIVGISHSMCIKGYTAFYGSSDGAEGFYEEGDIKLADSLEEYYAQHGSYEFSRERLDDLLGLAAKSHTLEGAISFLRSRLNLTT